MVQHLLAVDAEGDVMLFKIFTLHALPYIVGTGSLVLAAQQVVPSLAPSDPSTKAKIFSSQVVNRSSKGDRLPIHQAGDPQHKSLPPIVPILKTRIVCEPPFSTLVRFSMNNVSGRCFADVARSRYASG